MVEFEDGLGDRKHGPEAWAAGPEACQKRKRKRNRKRKRGDPALIASRLDAPRVPNKSFLKIIKKKKKSWRQVSAGTSELACAMTAHMYSVGLKEGWGGLHSC